MSNSNDARQDNSAEDPESSGNEQERAGHSGEGAASALAQLKTQTRQHRRQSAGDAEESSGGGGGGQ